MIRFKPEVRVGYFNRALAVVLNSASMWSVRARIDVEINSINDSQHSAESLHPYDLAIDLDTVGDGSSDLGLLHAWLARYLPAGYDVVFEGDHVHVEWDMHRPRTVTPAIAAQRPAND